MCGMGQKKLQKVQCVRSIMPSPLGKKGLENVFAISREHVLSADLAPM
jgi:hypothetical protein